MDGGVAVPALTLVAAPGQLLAEGQRGAGEAGHGEHGEVEVHDPDATVQRG